MNGAHDEFTLLPTDLDRLRLEQLDQSQQEGRVEAENMTWVVLRYTTSPMKAQSAAWCEWSLLVNCPGSPPRSSPYEFKNLKATLTFMEQLEQERKRTEESGS